MRPQRPHLLESAEPTNIRLRPKLKLAASKMAGERYGWSLTRMITALLEKEVKRPKRGLINPRKI